MNLHIVKWDEESALWRMRVLQNVDPSEPMRKCRRGTQPWLAWNTPQSREGLIEYVEPESVAAFISPEGDILLYYRPAWSIGSTSIWKPPATWNGSNANGPPSAKSPWKNWLPLPWRFRKKTKRGF